MIRVLVVDDHKLFRQGVHALLMSAQDIKIVGEARDGKEGVSLTQSLQPDVVLMDLEMPHLDGLQATRQLTQTNSSAKVLVLSMRTHEQDVRQAAASGALGYLVKNCSREELIAAIRSVHEGRVACSAETAPFFSKDGS